MDVATAKRSALLWMLATRSFPGLIVPAGSTGTPFAWRGIIHAGLASIREDGSYELIPVLGQVLSYEWAYNRIRGAQSLRERRMAKCRYLDRPDRAVVLRRDGNKCRYCGAIDPSLAIDHVIPFSRGGTKDLGNLVAACKSCNSRKKDRTPAEAGMPLLPCPTGGDACGSA